MATKAIPSRSLLSRLAPHSLLSKPLTQQRRAFIPLPGTSDSQSLAASRILPYKSDNLYDIIADVDSYVHFIPYCVESKVTSWSGPDVSTGRRWPSQADLTVGWGGINETYMSRLFCVPGSVVEALSGDAETDLRREDIKHHFHNGAGEIGSRSSNNSIFKSLRTRWTVTPVSSTGSSGVQKTDVRLTVDFQFSNPLYAALSMAAAPKLAGIMIEAFEERVRKVLGGGDDCRGKGIKDTAERGRGREVERKGDKMGA